MFKIFKSIRFHLSKSLIEGINYDTLNMVGVLLDSTDKIKKEKPEILSDSNSPIQKLDKDIFKIYIQEYESNKVFRSLLVYINCSAEGLVYMSTKHGLDFKGIIADSSYIKENFKHNIDTTEFTAEEVELYNRVYNSQEASK
jgi:hypothetical protein